MISLAVALSLSGTAFANSEEKSSSNEATNFTQAIEEGKAKLSLRYRYENVDQDGFSDEAETSAVRVRLNFKTKEFNNFGFFLEADHLAEVWDTDFNSITNGRSQFPVIADPLFTEMNQAYVSYSGISDTMIKYGRQRINLDNQRFVGGVGWRQNEQTYDGTTLVNTSIEDLTIVYAYLTNVNTILDTNFSNGTHNIFNASYSGLPFGTVSGYAYLLEDISDTTGIRLKGKQKFDNLTFGYELEGATQETDNAASVDTNYYNLSASLGTKQFTGKFGYEVHTSVNGVSFQTPLGTNHAFNGWADKFLGVPGTGLEDVYVGAIVPAAGMTFKLFYHDFTSEEDSIDYGTEIDFVAVKKFNKNYSLTFKYASYSADDFSVDTDKFWIMLSANF